MTFTPFVILWCILALSVGALALYRKFVANQEEDLVHLGPGEEKEIPKQVQLAAKLETVDRWGKTLTVVAFVFGLLLASVFLYQAWIVSLSHKTY